MSGKICLHGYGASGDTCMMIIEDKECLCAVIEERDRLRKEHAAAVQEWDWSNDEIERLRAGISEAICYLSPSGCKAMNEAMRQVSDNPDGEA
jgi:hypothetical protein